MIWVCDQAQDDRLRKLSSCVISFWGKDPLPPLKMAGKFVLKCFQAILSGLAYVFHGGKLADPDNPPLVENSTFLFNFNLIGYFLCSKQYSKANLWSTHEVVPFLFCMFSLILTFDFDLIFGLLFTFRVLMGYFYGCGRVQNLFWGLLMQFPSILTFDLD